eukprot:TRINITY_DN6184_c0_g1_i1.p1 TRINITY_DN6184_c0_g1~~TRINITY_DN6184_c0_g1_i1.p1  ORF type:complete len:847 (-),score=155.28 TRINITY_DN6184_c0_g1_i1:124-2664(-)
MATSAEQTPTLRRRETGETRRMDASSIFSAGLVDELKAAQQANNQKTADILDTIQRVTSKKVVIDKEGQMLPDCGSCNCQNFEPNLWKPGVCRICQHDHSKVVGQRDPGATPTLSRAGNDQDAGKGDRGVSNLPLRRVQRVKPVSRAEKLSRVLLASGLVETVSIQPVRRSGNDSESRERHFVANIFVVEGVDSIDINTAREIPMTARSGSRSVSLNPSVSAPLLTPKVATESAEKAKLEEWKKNEELRLLDAEISLVKAEKRLRKKFPDSEDISSADDIKHRLKDLQKRRKDLKPPTPEPVEPEAPQPTPVEQTHIVPDPSAPAPPPLPPASRSESPSKRSRRKSVSKHDESDETESSQDGAEGAPKRALRRSSSIKRRSSVSAGNPKKMTRPASTTRMDPAALQSELANVVGRSLVVKTESFLRSSEQPLNEEIAYGKFDYPEHDIFFYRDNFLRNADEFVEVEKSKKFYRIARYTRLIPEDFQDHVNVFAISNDKDHPEKMIISIKKTPDEYENYVGLIRSKLGDRPLTISTSELKRDKRASGNPAGPHVASTKEIITALRKQFPMFANFKLCVSESNEFPSGEKKGRPIQVGSLGEKNSYSMVPVKYLPVDLLQLDRTLKVQCYKFGVVYVKKGQEKEKHYFANTEDEVSQEFLQFIEFLGQRITLKGWRGYRGDLDNRENTTGTHSIYTEFEDLEIMFHIAPMLPPDTRQRLIGNDIVALIWLEPGVVWNPESIVSQVMHAQIVVQQAETRSGELGVRIDCAVRDGVPSTRPVISPKRVYELDEELRDILLRKMVNCERSSWHCNKKVRAQTRSLQEHYGATRQGQLDFLIERYIDAAKEY